MSKTFASRPALSQRGRGRGREQANSTNTQPSVQGERLSPSRVDSNRGGSVRGSSVRGGTTGRGTVGRGGTVSRGRGGRGGRMDPNGVNPGVNPGENEGAGDSSQAGNSLQGRATYTGAYTVISPDEKKRRQIMQQAQRESQQYEQYKQRNKPTSFSYVGTAGGGEMSSVDEATARQQQIQSHSLHSKTSRLLREQERKSQQRQMEDRELQLKKEAARKKAEMNSQQQRNRQQNLKSDMQRVNQAFLDRLEAQTKTAPQPKEQATPQPHQPSNPQRVSPPQPQTSRSSVGKQQRLSQSKVTSYSTTSARAETQRSEARNSSSTHNLASRSTSQGQSAYASPLPAGESHAQVVSSDGEQSELCHNLGLLQNMFPHYEPTILLNILEQCNGSVEQALLLLEA